MNSRTIHRRHISRSPLLLPACSASSRSRALESGSRSETPVWPGERHGNATHVAGANVTRGASVTTGHNVRCRYRNLPGRLRQAIVGLVRRCHPPLPLEFDSSALLVLPRLRRMMNVLSTAEFLSKTPRSNDETALSGAERLERQRNTARDCSAQTALAFLPVISRF